MRFLTILALSATLLTASEAMEQPSFHTKGTPTGKATGTLKPGEYWWKPQLSPGGPVTVVVSIPHQIMHVYRNGILIGRSSVSTGSKGHDTPGGTFTILEKKARHHSKKYDNAPMPYMQRLTWSGIAMHSGHLPGYAASHGCIRLPYDFSVLLFGITDHGGTVMITNGKEPMPHFAAGSGLMPASNNTTPAAQRTLGSNDYDWHPERSKTGPITVVASSADRALYVYRNGKRIGRAALDVSGRGSLGENTFTLLEGTTKKQSSLAPGRAARRWVDMTSNSDREVHEERIAARLRFNPELGHKLYDTMSPGATIIITDQPAERKISADSTYFGS